MFILLSPAKKLIEPPGIPDLPATQPEFLAHTRELIAVTKALQVDDLRQLMGISEALATLNHTRFQEFSLPFNATNARQAALSFQGDVYLGLDAASLDPDDLQWAQTHVGILSGLYGLLRPLDLIQPYRLEMGTKLQNPRGKDLYAFWGNELAAAVDAACEDSSGTEIINLASKEYFKAASPKSLRGSVITPVFQDVKEGRARTISYFAKRARGEMARWAILNRITQSEELKSCREGGYTFAPDASSATRWVFQRPQPPPVNG